MSIGSNIKQIRISLGLSQEQLSKRTGIDPATIRKYENGQFTTPKHSTLERIAAGLNVNVNVLLGNDISEDTAMHNLFQMYNTFGGNSETSVLTAKDISKKVKTQSLSGDEIYISFSELNAAFQKWQERLSSYNNEIASISALDDSEKEAALLSAENRLRMWENLYPNN